MCGKHLRIVFRDRAGNHHHIRTGNVGCRMSDTQIEAPSRLSLQSPTGL